MIGLNAAATDDKDVVIKIMILTISSSCTFSIEVDVSKECANKLILEGGSHKLPLKAMAVPRK